MKVNRQIWNLCRILSSGGFYNEVEKKYEKLTNLVLGWGGRIHGSQHSNIVVEGVIYETIVVYFEVPKDSLNQFLEEEANLQ